MLVNCPLKVFPSIMLIVLTGDIWFNGFGDSGQLTTATYTLGWLSAMKSEDIAAAPLQLRGNAQSR